MEPLADVGLATMQRFKYLQEVEQPALIGDEPYEWPKSFFLAQVDRFELWAVNLGLFVMGHGALDYRIRDSESMKEAIYKMMKNLNRSLDEVLDYLNGNIELGDEDSDVDSEMGSDMDLLLDSIKDPIDRLYKLAVWIRNPATRLPSSKARNFQQIDEETKVDLFKAFESWDYDYVSSLFLEYEKHKAIQEHPTVEYQSAVGDNGGLENEDEVWEPVGNVLKLNKDKRLRGTESYLVHRIAQANGRRRQQFAYWRKHKDKLREHTSVVMEAPTQESSTTIGIKDGEIEKLKAPLSVTTATQLRLSQIAGKEVLEKEDVLNLSISEYAPSAWNPSKDVVSFPAPPKISPTDNFFECPYCYTICPASLLSERAWSNRVLTITLSRAHLIRDLRPYICTYEQCLNPEQLYDSRDDWIHHETSTHRKILRCPEHEDQMFTTLVAFEEHSQAYHKEDPVSPSFADSATGNVQRSCPICSIVLGSVQKLQSHIALHLERFAIFSLPRSLDAVEKMDFESDGAEMESDRSLNGDLGLDSNSTDDISDTHVEIHPNDPIPEEMINMRNAISRIRAHMRTKAYYQHLTERQEIQSQLKSHVKRVRWKPYEFQDTVLFELGDACLEAWLITEATEMFGRIKALHSIRLGYNNAILLQTEEKLALVSRINEARRNLPNYDQFDVPGPGTSMILDVLASVGGVREQAEMVWGPDIWRRKTTRDEKWKTIYGQLFGEDTPDASLLQQDHNITQESTSKPQDTLNSTVSDNNQLPPTDRNLPCNTLYIGNLSLDTSEEELKTMFSAQQGYKRLCFLTERKGPICFIEFEDVSFATKALRSLDGKILHNDVDGALRIDFAKTPLSARFDEPPSGEGEGQESKEEEVMQLKRTSTTSTEREAREDENPREDPEMQEEREQIEAEEQLFKNKFRLLKEDIAAELVLKNQEAQSDSEIQALARQMRLLWLDFASLKVQYTKETQKTKKTEKAQAFSTKMRSLEYIARKTQDEKYKNSGEIW
ncbi:hypothetical protein TARUN_9733 [Trichoderma arundinaceum]|uniref:RRM domain-containing protein n=1 Tax=Trichoderma arundinaceum TaxID=490622 RepID=A0A395NA12_TRIAR|nr:hypothetical protein TARUN_9733 [Trichoderma arundinaceum]